MAVMPLSDLNHEQVTELHAQLIEAYDDLVAQGLSLNLTRGKPASAQLDLSNELLTLPGDGQYTAADGTDCRNYGGLTGLVEIREIFAELLGIPVAQLLAGDNSSLSIMHDTLVWCLLKGTTQGEPWVGQPVKFICPVPGYDRHFALCEQYGIEMIPVPLGDHGPDLAAVAELAADPSVKGMWVVPTYANPTGAIYDEATTQGLVSMAAAPDFRIFWDNAYAVHHLTDVATPPLDVLGMAAAAGNPDRVYAFASTSKITFAGAGVSFFGGSPANIAWYQRHLSKRSIGPDKVNHLRHARYLGDADGVRALMAKHRALIAPKFEQVDAILTKRLGEYETATWTHPIGGYFISLDVADGTASRVVALAKDAGIAMTGAGAAFPHGNDPRDRNIRIAPTFPGAADVAVAIDGLATCVLLAATEQMLAAQPASARG
jgi:DNA-binding transcriptional MocR family regulator